MEGFNRLGMFCKEIKNYSKGVIYLGKALEICKKTLGAKSPVARELLLNLSLMHGALGQHELERKYVAEGMSTIFS